MEIVIDIPDRIHFGIEKGFCANGSVASQIVLDAVKNGTPLPKGHGVLKDTDKIISDGRSKGFCNWYDEMKYAPKIIEASTESENEKC